MLIPKKQEQNNGAKRKWFKSEKVKKFAKKDLSQEKKDLAKKYVKGDMKEVVLSYVCSGCKHSFNSESLRKQFIEMVRTGNSFVSCPKCGVALVADRITKVASKVIGKVNRNANLVAVYPNQGIVPGYVPNQWVDRAILEKIAHELGKFAQTVGMFNPQLRFQRGIRGSVREGSPSNVKSAEFTIESVDDKDLRFRVVATAGITPAGKVVLPEVFSTLDGREIPFTKEGVAGFVSGKVFNPAEPTLNVPTIYRHERDFTRFREIVAKKKTASEYSDYKSEITRSELKKLKKEYDMEDEPDQDFIDWWGRTHGTGYPIKIVEGAKKTAAGIPTPGQKVEYQGKMYTIDTTMGDASVLRDETGMQTAPILHTDMNVQVEPGTLTAPTAPTAAVADKIEKLVKKSLRDEKTLVPFTDSDPDYSVAKQTDVDPDFSVPYEKSDQGILPEEDRAVQKMFRGGASIIPTEASIKKTAEPMEEEYATITFPYLKVDMERLEEFGGPEYYPRDKFIVYKNAEGKFTSDYPEADESFEGDTVEDVANQIRNLLNSDDVVYNAGRPKIDIKKKEASIKEAAMESSITEKLPNGWEIEIYPYSAHGKVWYEIGVVAPDGDVEALYTSTEVDENNSGAVNAVETQVREKFEEYKKEVSKRQPPDKTASLVRVSFRVGEEVRIDDEIVEIINIQIDRGDKLYTIRFSNGNTETVVEEELEKVAKRLFVDQKLKKLAEPTGYHETDETGKQISIDRLRQLVEDYVRAGQMPLDFDLTKITSEVSRMTRKELEEIIDKKLKNQHYPVVHAKKDGLEKASTIELFPTQEGALKRVNELEKFFEGGRYFITVPIILNEDDIDRFGAKVVEGETNPGEEYFVVAENVEEVKSWGLKSRILASKKIASTWTDLTNQLVDILSGTQGTLEDIENAAMASTSELNAFLTVNNLATLKEWVQEELIEEKGFIAEGITMDDILQIFKKYIDPKKIRAASQKTADKYLFEGTSVKTLGGLSGVVMEVMPDYKFRTGIVGTGYKVSLDDGRQIVYTLADLEKEKVASIKGKSTNEIVQEIRKKAQFIDFEETPEGVERIKLRSEKWKNIVQYFVQKYSEEKSVSKTNIEESVSEYEVDEAVNFGDDIDSMVDNILRGLKEKGIKIEASKLRFAQDVDVKEKPKTEFKELKTKPHGKPLPEEVKIAPAASPEMQKTFNDVQLHKQRLTEIQSIVDDARRKVEEQIRAIQEEHGSVTEAAELQRGIEKLGSLIEQAQTQVVDFGELLAYLDTSIKEKKFKPSDKWKVEKLLEKFGEEAKTYLERAEKGASSLNEEIQQRVLTIFPKRESSVKEANVFDAIKELGSGLWNYIKTLREVVEQGEQLELVL